MVKEYSWIKKYQSKIVTVDEALSHLKSEETVYLHPGSGTPEILINAMVKQASRLENVKVVQILTFGDAPYAKPEMKGHFKVISLFTGPNVRKAVNEGRAEFVPVFLGEIPELFYSREIDIDVALIQVSPPDEHGFCSFGVGVDVTMAACRTAKTIIAHVNPRMPRVHGDNFIHFNKLSYVVEEEIPLLELPRAELTDTFMKIGKNVAGLIEDESTLQMGIGGIPDAVLYFLKDKRDLGIHTEMFSDGVVELYQEGIITNEKKTLHPGKMVAGFVLGSTDLFNFIHNNPVVEFHPQEYINDPFIIAKNHKMVSINSALEVDLTGQICADSIGINNYSGIGGQVDFFRGSARSKGGKPILALPASAKNGTISRIVPMLKP
ncbi:MAG: acetyl-CoA hydrolase/transferase family protein, partial [Candidatus Marinimicrobia bacterium]|nr:acetyl-CoA hydrolase/transferase family protein [Candidatus Neomarinimicrobiota bacterium]